jgi:hypothetical protein
LAPQLDQLNDPILTRVYNRLRVEGYGRKVLDVGDRRIIILSEPLKALTGRDWSVLIVVPETDFVGFVTTGGWIALVMSGLVGVIMVVLAALLIWRGVLAERRGAAAAVREGVLEEHAQAFADLGTLIDRASRDGVRAATARVVVPCGATRAGIWRFTPDGRTLACEDCYDRAATDHTSGMELYRDELPKLFAALATRQCIDTVNADRDPRTSELSAVYLEPLGIDGVYISPIVSGDKLAGILMLEAPRRGSWRWAQRIRSALSSLLALRFPPDADCRQPPFPRCLQCRRWSRSPPAGPRRTAECAGASHDARMHIASHARSPALASGRIDQVAVGSQAAGLILTAQRLTDDERRRGWRRLSPRCATP